MIIYDFTTPELDYFRRICNFTADERALFDLRAKQTSIERCAEVLGVSVSTAKRISKKVNSKIIRVL